MSNSPDIIDLNESNSNSVENSSNTGAKAEHEPAPDEASSAPSESTESSEPAEEAQPDENSQTEADEPTEEVRSSESDENNEEVETAEEDSASDESDTTENTNTPTNDGDEESMSEASNDAQTDDQDSSEVDSSEDSTTPDQQANSSSNEGSQSGFHAIVEASTIQDALESLSVLVDECKIRLHSDELSVRAVDPANVAMADLSLEQGAFEHYSGGGGVIGVNLNRLEDIVNMANSGDLINLELNERTRKLDIKFDGLSYTLSLIDPDSIRQEPDIPELDLAAEIVLEGSQIDRGVKAADMVSDHIRLRVDDAEEALYIEADGDTDDVNLKLTREDLIALNSGTANSLFSLDYLKDLNKAFPSDAEITTELGDDFPVKFHFNFAEGLANTTYMLAPRIQSD